MAIMAEGGLLPFQLEKQYRDYVWGGSRLRTGHVPTAEVWTVYETNQVMEGPYSGKTLGDLAGLFGADLVGTNVTKRIGKRFPLLVKILDCNDWLSLQVHPNDKQAAELEGPGQFGKTEAWYFIEVDTDAEILCGVKTGVTDEELANSVRDGSVLEHTQRVNVIRDDHVLIPAGTIHALGPGLLVYEVQESSDITYRVFDWNRPASQGRVLHIEKSIKVLDAEKEVVVQPTPKQNGSQHLLDCAYFSLDKITPSEDTVSVNLDRSTFHALTVIAGDAAISGEGWYCKLERFDSLIIPACTPAYTINCQKGTEILRVSA